MLISVICVFVRPERGGTRQHRLRARHYGGSGARGDRPHDKVLSPPPPALAALCADARTSQRYVCHNTTYTYMDVLLIVSTVLKIMLSVTICMVIANQFGYTSLPP